MEEQKFDSIATSLKEFLYGSANRLQAVAMHRNLHWNRSMEPIALLATRFFASWHLHLLILHPPLSLGTFSSTVCIQVFESPCARGKPSTVTALVQEVKRLQLAGVAMGGAAISSSLQMLIIIRQVLVMGFPLASQIANQVSPAINQMSSFDSHVRPTIVSMPQTVDQTSDYSGMDSAVAVSGVVQRFCTQESGRAKPTRVRACYICDDPDRLRSACPFGRNCHRCLQPGHLARACLATRPVRGESASRTAGGGQVTSLSTEVQGLIMVSAVV